MMVKSNFYILIFFIIFQSSYCQKKLLRFEHLTTESGLGTKLISVFIRQLNGSIELLKKEGTMYKIVFQNNSN